MLAIIVTLTRKPSELLQRGSVSTYGRWFWVKLYGGGLLIGLAAEFIALWGGLGLVRASLLAYGVVLLYDLPMIFMERRRAKGLRRNHQAATTRTAHPRKASNPFRSGGIGLCQHMRTASGAHASSITR